MTRPIKLPTWATSSPNILEPSDGKKAQGWVPGEQPPAAIFNYWQNLVHEWITWLDEAGVIEDSSPTFGNVQVNGTLGTTGNTTVGTDGSANLQVNGTLGTTGLATVAGLQVNGTLTTTGQANVTGDVKATGLFGYTTPPTRTKVISIARATGDVFLKTTSGAVSSKTGGHVAWPIDLPHGATISSVDIIGIQSSTAPSTLGLYRRINHDWTSGNEPNLTAIASNTTPSVGGTYKRTFSPGYLVDNANEEYQVRLVPGSTADEVQGIRVQFIDPGPRNH
jgi:hypothetical protein